ncbi:MAG: serine/threonine protein kinase [Myxococcales bacterium]|nr:serine/threonine protein kinase [Myxococcales bacterium]
MARGRLTEHEALVYTRGIASALSAAHALGIVHRDLKPDNIFLVRDPDMVGGLRPKILDFGIAKVAEAQRVGGSSKTRTGAVLGTPTYMSPEQCRGTGDIDHRSDLYSVGCILYEMLVGRPPFSSEGIGEVLGMHLYMAPVPPSETGVVVSAAAENLILSLCRRSPRIACSRPPIWRACSARARCQRSRTRARRPWRAWACTRRRRRC